MDADAADDAVRARIAAVYADGPWKLGWSYIYGQPDSRHAPRIVTIGLNPGGGRGDADWDRDANLDQRASPGIANAYFDERWGPRGTLSPLQTQFRVLAALNPHVPVAHWLSFQFVPFRSPGWAALPDCDRAVALGVELLPWALGRARPALIVGFGLAPVKAALTGFLRAELVETCPTGWGATVAEHYRLPHGGRLVLLPHLSRYQVLGRGHFPAEARLLTA